MLQTLNRRPCKLGTSINTRTEMHGDESVPAMDIPLQAIMLNAQELNILLAEPHAHDALFNQRADGLAEPLFPMLKAFKFKHKFENCKVSIRVGLDLTEISFEGVKLTGLQLQPMVGGLTELSLQIQCTPDLEDGAAMLLAWLNRDADVEIAIGSKETSSKQEASDTQPELPLNGADATAAESKAKQADPVH